MESVFLQEKYLCFTRDGLSHFGFTKILKISSCLDTLGFYDTSLQGKWKYTAVLHIWD